MKKKQMLAGISVVALSLATAGCAPEQNDSDSFGSAYPSDESNYMSNDDREDAMEDQTGFDDCDQMELVQGDAYSGDEKEVWYCNDDSSEQRGSFFMPFVAGYFTSSMLNSKHGINVSNYKPGSSKKIVSATQYNKSASKPLPSFGAVKKSSTSVKSKSSSSSRSTSNKSSSFGSGSKSSGFGSSTSSSGG